MFYDKKIICLCFSIIFILLPQQKMSVLANSNIQVFINNEKVQFDVDTIIINGRMFVPIRAVCEKMGADVSWEKGLVLIVKNNIKIGLDLGSRDIFVIRCNNFNHLLYMVGYDIELSNYSKEYEMDVEPIIIDGRTLLPIRYVCEELGASVDWKSRTSTVEITYSEELIHKKMKTQILLQSFLIMHKVAM